MRPFVKLLWRLVIIIITVNAVAKTSQGHQSTTVVTIYVYKGVVPC